MENNFKFTKGRFFVILVLVLIGIALCCDLSYIFYKTNFHEVYVPSFCNVSQLIDCDGVSTTEYALTLGVPNALWGMLLYLVMLMLLFVDRIQNKFKNTIFDVFENPRSYIATLALLSFLLSMVLAFISLKVINKICILCFATYFVDLFIALTARTKGLFFEDIKITILDFIKGVKKYTVLFLIVLTGFVGALYYFDSTTIFSPKIKKQKMFKEFNEAKTNKYAIKGNVLGKKNAPVKVVIYSDYNCPFCRVANIMVHKAAKTQNILVEEYSYPLDTSCNNYIGRTLGGHENSCELARYALAAKKQEKFWGATSAFFDNDTYTIEQIEKALNDAHLGLDINKLKEDAQSPEIVQELFEEIEFANKKGIHGTPSVEIDGILYLGMPPYDEFIEKIKQAQKREKLSK